MADDTPVGIRTFIESTNNGDSEAFVAAFTDDATLDDWDRAFHGRAGVAAWNQTDNIGVQAHFELIEFHATGAADTFIATLTVTGNGYNGTGPMTFVLRGDKIAGLTIAPTP